MQTDLTILCVSQQASAREAMVQIDRSRQGIVLVVDEARRLVGTITDGDIRRAILARIDLDTPVSALLATKAGSRFGHPVTGFVGEDRSVYLSVLQRHNIVHLPIVDADRRVVGLVTRDEFLPAQVLSLKAVIMAGGKGRRLHPLTKETPKPMLRIGEKPLLEILIQQLREAGITRVQMTTHHQRQKIEQHFKDGRAFGIELSYVAEHRPLGTVGGLSLSDAPSETTLVINGDILTQVNFRAMLAYHREHQADLTVAVRHHTISVPYGVIECEGPLVRRVREKPELDMLVNAGIYLLEPSVYRYIPIGERFDMTDLISRLVSEGRPVVSFPVREFWADIGHHEDYAKAQEEIKQWASR